MKKVFLTIVLLAGISLSSFAQEAKKEKKDRKNPMKELNLTTEQEQKLKELRESYKTSSKELNQQHQAAVKSILTPEQQTKLDESRKSRLGKEGKGNFAHHKHHKGQRGHGKGKLTPEALAKLDTLEDTFFTEKKAIKMSRVAPEEQSRRITELRKKYRKDKMEIVKEARKSARDVQNPS